MEQNQQQWTTIIKPRTGWFDIDLKELWQYRDLVVMFVKRSFATLYKQTILGPAWILINPLLTTVIFTVVFGNIAGLAESGVPSFLFYMAGNAIWSFFASCITGTANTFVTNAGLFGKVYFPRLTMPISQVVISFINLLIQMLMFFCFWVWFYFFGQEYGTVQMNLWVLALPAVLLLVMVMGLGVGIIVSSLTTKYRDLAIVVSFGVQLWMYATPVVYSMSEIAAGSPRLLVLMRLNPMTEPVQVFRYALLGCGEISPAWLLYSAVVALVTLAAGVVLFSRVEKTFMDTV
ncbi:ABC transporter permease [Candidatus Allofournierella excrementavium]|uniref:ABC transporter permease n=3 Tax=Candidatus Allofournierella excrementavium TaxID=2838591 RepID=UPI003AB1ABCB